MKKNNSSYLIEKYNNGEMSDSDKQWFEKRLIGDKKLRDEANLRRSTDEILEHQNIISLRNKLSGIERRRDAKKHFIQPKIPVHLKYAAVLVGIVLIGSISLFFRKNISGDEILNRYYKVYEPPTAQRSGQSVANVDFARALEFYNTHDYGNAAILFNKVVERNPGDMQSELLSGVANFGDKKYPEAKQSFVNVINDNNNFFIENAKWYLALCYVKTDERKKAIKQFEIIQEDGGIYSNDAKKIIRRYK